MSTSLSCKGPRSRGSTHHDPSSTVGGSGIHKTRLDINELGQLVQFFFSQGLAQSTQRSYNAGKNRFITFCQEANLTPFPAAESTLCIFAAYLALQGLKHHTIKSYLSAVRHLQIEKNCFDPFNQQSLVKLELVLKGVKRYQAALGVKSRPRLPITPSILRKIKTTWDRKAADPDYVMLWAACCLCFYGFLRAGEMTVQSDRGFDPSVNLDIAIDNPANPTLVRVSIKASKTDPFRKGVSIFLGRTYNDICPIAALLAYLAAKGQQGSGPLFCFKGGRYLTRQRFVEHACENSSAAIWHKSGPLFRAQF